MKKLLLVLPLTLFTAACETEGQRIITGAATGAAIGAAVADDDKRVEGAAIGGTVGIIAGALIGPANQAGKCRYRYPDGREYIADC